MFSSRRGLLRTLAIFCLALVAPTGGWPHNGKTTAEWLIAGYVPWTLPSHVTIERTAEGRYQYLVNGIPTTFIGIGYNAINRFLPDAERAANYHRDFKIMCEAGINHITGWDADKGYEQDKFDELTLEIALQYGIGVLMPINLPPEGDYRDPAFVAGLKAHAEEKALRFKDHPALRMWGVGNEVLTEMPREMYPAFAQAYLEIIDRVHELDANHPVIYREAEDRFVPAIRRFLDRRGERPWFLYGMNIYSLELERVLDEWPHNELYRPLFVTEFGAEPDWSGGRSLNYVGMWRMIRAHPDFALGGAPYVWTTEGPEPVDKKWGLMDGQSRPVDETFQQLAEEWRREADNAGRKCPA